MAPQEPLRPEGVGRGASMSDSAGDDFQRLTKYSPQGMGGRPGRVARPALYKTYSDKPRVELPGLKYCGAELAPFAEVVQRRRSIRSFLNDPLTLHEISFLLWASTGLGHTDLDAKHRTAPSAGALYPIETYVVANDIAGLTPGVYHYAIESHALDELRLGNCRQEITAAALGQGMCGTAPAVFIWTAVFNRTKWKYGQRGYRYVYLDCGHVAAQFALSAVAVGLGSFQIAALFDDEVNDIVGVDGEEESVLYMSVVGRLG